jgi:hypothetical protein
LKNASLTVAKTQCSVLTGFSSAFGRSSRVFAEPGSHVFVASSNGSTSASWTLSLSLSA